VPAIVCFAIHRRPDHDVCAAGWDQLIAARAPVDPAGRPGRAWHRPHHPVLAPPGVKAFGGRAKLPPVAGRLRPGLCRPAPSTGQITTRHRT